MTSPIDAKLDALTDPAFERLLAAARRSLERTGADLTANIGVTNPTDAERKAIAGLLGRYIKPGTKRIDINLAQLDSQLRARTEATLIEVLQTLGKPLRNLPDAAAQDTAARAALLDRAQASPLFQTQWFPTWVEKIRTDGTFTRLLNAPSRLEHAIRVLEHIDGTLILLPKLATRATGHSHALDARTPLAALVLTALAARAGTPTPKTTEQRRQLWDHFNVVVDDLASRVLVLNLPATGSGLGNWLTDAARYATPFHITLHQLLNHPIQLAPRPVYVCENPAVLREAAEILGPSSPPILCTEGHPSTAFHRLAAKITSSGGELHYHGDFDWPGILMTNAMISRHGATPWRMSTPDYLSGLHRTQDDDTHQLTGLSGEPRPTPWDPELREAMVNHNQPVFEEAVVDQLVTDVQTITQPMGSNVQRDS